MILSSVLLLVTALVPTSSREIQVNLQAPNWVHRTVHPLVEVSEFLADQSANDFWTYVDNLCSTSSSMDTVDAALRTNTDEALQSMSQLAHSVGVPIVPSNVENSLEIASNLGMYLPAVQFYESLASSTDAAAPCGVGGAYVIHYPGGVVSCSHEKTKSAVFNTTASVTLTDETVNMPWNHEYPFGPEKKLAAYEHSEIHVLYGVIGSTSFCKLHSHLRYVININSVTS
jgi:hypothetical protein